MRKKSLFVFVVTAALFCGCTSQTSSESYINLEVDTESAVPAILESVFDNSDEDLAGLQKAAGVATDMGTSEDCSFTVLDGVLLQGGAPVDTGTLSLDLRDQEIDDWSFLTDFINLEGLILNDENLTEEDLAVIGSLPSLKTLIFLYYPLENIDALATCTGLQFLDIGGADSLCDIGALAAFSALEYLKIDGAPNLTSGAAIGELKNLNVLFLQNVGFSDISFLSEETPINTLSCSYLSNVSDFSPVAKLSGLEYLIMFHCKFSDIGVLAGLSNLVQIDFYCTNVDSFAPLAEYQLSLKSIGCDASEEELEILKEAYPDCVFD